MRIKMTGISVENPLEAFEFYTKVLGFEKHTFIPEANLAIVVSPDDKNGITLLLEPNENLKAKAYQTELFQKNIPSIVLGVGNVQKEYERLLERGVDFQQIPFTNEWGTSAIFNDRCGNWIQIHQDQ